ncbi:MAG: UPF0175 family protein [Methanosarcinales archaeon]
MISLDEKISSLIDSGYFTNKDQLFKSAFRTLLEFDPSIKIVIAIELYKKEKISLGKASEIAGLSREEFKDILRSRGISRKIGMVSIEEMNKGVNLILQT